MSEAELRDVVHSCGHTRSTSVAGKKPFEVAGWLSWLGKKPCPECDPKFAAKRAAALAKWKKDQLEQARVREKSFGLKPLTGPASIVGWATQVRVELVARAWESLGLDEDEFAAVVAGPAGEVNAAGWWLDNRGTGPEALPGLLAEALGTSVDGALENPFE